VTTDQTATIRVDLNALRGLLQVALANSAKRVALGLRAADLVAADLNLELPDVNFQLQLAGQQKPGEAEVVRTEFKTWTLCNGLRDSVEALASFLEECRTVCAIYSLGSSFQIQTEDWQKRIVDNAQKFHQLGLPHKVEHLAREFHSDLRPSLTSDVLTMNLARNCLVHRKGVVTQLDVNSPDGLRVTWLKPELLVTGKAGERVLVLPETVEEGETIAFKQSPVSRLFKLGERIEFTPQEFSEMSWTFHAFSSELVARIEKFGRDRGIVPTASNSAARQS